MLIINDHENTLFLEFGFIPILLLKKLMHWNAGGREGLWLNLEYICSNQGLVLTKMSVHGELGHSTRLSSSGASDHCDQSTVSSQDR